MPGNVKGHSVHLVLNGFKRRGEAEVQEHLPGDSPASRLSLSCTNHFFSNPEAQELENAFNTLS